MQTSFFDLDNRFSQLSNTGDPLDRLKKVIDFELFRSTLELVDVKARKSNAGRKPNDRVLMFKMLILQHMYKLSDDALEYQVVDRLSFMRFLGLSLSGQVPDAKTVWLFRDELTNADLIKPLFARFEQALTAQGVQLNSGQIVDATFVEVPRQRNKREENEQIKAGNKPTDWKAKKSAQKDTDARWTKKNNERYYGYKDHINIDAATKLITEYAVTDASVHDSQLLIEVLRPAAKGGAIVHADSAYRSEKTEEALLEAGYSSEIHERAYRNMPLTKDQEAANTVKSTIRARVEHVFGSVHMSMGGTRVRSVGINRAKTNIGLMNLAYNIKRVETLIRNNFFEFDRINLSFG